jgi:hypothetical protein
MTGNDKAVLKGGILDKENEEALAAALAFYGSPEEVRQSMTALLCALAEHFRSRGAAIPWQLRLLIGGLEDLDRGTVSDFLRPSGSGTRQEPGAIWEAKAALVVALETRMRWGEPKEVAARAVVRAAGYGTAQKLIGWKKQFSRKTSQVPRDGQHWGLLEEWRAELKRCDSLVEERPAALQSLLDGAIRHARQLLSDKKLSGGRA